MPLITDADGVWIMTVQWDCLGGVRPVRIERLKVRVDDNVDLVDTPRESATQEQPPPERPRFGQKRFPAEAIEPQDRIFWSKSGADLMMTVDTASHTMHNGVRCRRFTGMTYALNSGGVGDPITGAPRGEAGWTIPEDQMVLKAVPWADAEGTSVDDSQGAGDRSSSAAIQDARGKWNPTTADSRSAKKEIPCITNAYVNAVLTHAGIDEWPSEAP